MLRAHAGPRVASLTAASGPDGGWRNGGGGGDVSQFRQKCSRDLAMAAEHALPIRGPRTRIEQMAWQVARCTCAFRMDKHGLAAHGP